MRAARARPPVSSRWLAEGVTVAEGRRDGVGDGVGVGVGVSVTLGGAGGLSVLWLRTRYPTSAPEVTTSRATATSAAISGARRGVRGGAGGGGTDAAARGPRKACGTGRTLVSSPGATSSCLPPPRGAHASPRSGGGSVGSTESGDGG